jgi:hypothetical protein
MVGHAFRSFCKPGAGHAFTQAALLHEGPLQLTKLLIQKVVWFLDVFSGWIGWN